MAEFEVSTCNAVGVTINHDVTGATGNTRICIPSIVFERNNLEKNYSFANNQLQALRGCIVDGNVCRAHTRRAGNAHEPHHATSPQEHADR